MPVGKVAKVMMTRNNDPLEGDNDRDKQPVGK
jgi:hypothetical protein